MLKKVNFTLVRSLIFVAASFLSVSPVYGATISVTSTADNLTAGDTFCTLREAIMNANANADTTSGDCVAGSGADIISIPAGTYSKEIVGSFEDNNVTGDFDTTDAAGITIQGAGATTTTINGANLDRVFHATGDIIINGVTVTGGTTSGDGGGLYANSSATIQNSIFSRNTTTTGDGGGLRSGSTTTIQNSTFSENTATNGKGGGLYTFTTAAITSSIFSKNIAGSWGGGLFAMGSSVTVTSSTFSMNAALNAAGGLYTAGTATIENSTFSENSSPSWGGGLYANSSATIQNSTFSNNTTTAGDGGGLYANSSATIQNSTFSGNTATSRSGGGLYAKNSATIENSTFSGNTASTFGGGLAALGSATITNSIIANSTVGGDCSGIITSGGNNISSDASCSFVAAGDMPNTNPLLGSLANNGGPTMTHALLAGSPAIDTGAGCAATDQRGIARPQGVRCDIGAYEFPGFSVTATAGTGGTITPPTASVSQGATTTFTVTPAAGFNIGSVTGCSGSLTGNTYTTGVITAACNVAATFAKIPPPPPPPPPPTGGGTGGGTDGNGGTGGDTSIILASPDNGVTVVGSSVALIWKRLTDSEKEEFNVHLCEDETFENCEPTLVTSTVSEKVVFGLGTGVLMFGFIMGGALKTRRGLLLLTVALLTFSQVVACGTSNDDTADNGTGGDAGFVESCKNIETDKACYEATGLLPSTTYYWKVDGGSGGANESETRSFTTN